MNKARLVVGTHAFFAREGVAFTVPTNGTTPRTAKPGNADASWLDPQRLIDPAELAHMCSLTVTELDELVEYGSLLPLLGEGSTVRQFSAACVVPLRETTTPTRQS